MSKIKVLVVDDSPTMRQLVTRVLENDPDIDVVGSAKSAQQARELIKLLTPDVMTLDVEMPEMDGLSFLEKVMRLRPMPVVMVSTLTARGTDTTIAALALGAVDCVVKPSAEHPNRPWCRRRRSAVPTSRMARWWRSGRRPAVLKP
jgi:two-component system chemotaxis response regulator CheB